MYIAVIFKHTHTHTGPDGCTEEFVGGMPVYCGFELDVLQSLVKYFQALSDPLISVKLYDLHKAVHSKALNYYNYS